MYRNIGKKIKGLAKIIAYVGIFLSCLVGIASIFGFLPFAFIAIAAIGSFIFWLSGFFTYGFGELIDQTTEINQKLSAEKMEQV